MKIRNNGVNRLYKKWLVENYACPTTFKLFLREDGDAAKSAPTSQGEGPGIFDRIKELANTIWDKMKMFPDMCIFFLNIPARMARAIFDFICPESWKSDAANAGFMKRWFVEVANYLDNMDLNKFSIGSTAVMVSAIAAAIYFGYKYYKKHKRPVGAREWAMYLGRKIKETF